MYRKLRVWLCKKFNWHTDNGALSMGSKYNPYDESECEWCCKEIKRLNEFDEDGFFIQLVSSWEIKK